jgi:hypothetical protein
VSDVSRGGRTPTDVQQNGPPSAFHRGFARAVRSGQNFSSTVLLGNESVPFVAGRLRTVDASATAGPVFDHVFDFVDPRVDRTIGDTATALRNQSQWRYVPAPGVGIPLGTNFNFAFANAAQSATINFLAEADGQSGAIVTCAGTTRPCFFAGTGAFDGFYGEADSRNPATLGLTADTGSFTLVTQQALALPEGSGACPPGLPPPPGNLIASRNTFSAIQVGWDSVACARRYIIRFFSADGSSIDQSWDATRLLLTVDNPFRLPVAGLASFSVASVNEAGAAGPFSPPHPIPRPRL